MQNEESITSCSHHLIVFLQHGDSLKCIGRINTTDFKFEPHLPTTFFEYQPVCQLVHDEDTFTCHLIVGWQITIARIIKTMSFIDHLDIDATATGTKGQRYVFGRIRAIAMQDSIFHSLQHSYGHCRVVAAHIIFATKMEKTLLNLRQIINIRLYYK